ncbi:MAG: hypothetical protein JSU85_14465 [Candidatus Zixiibacteriota bacterium]|nr:MAG: hypothetical protein JSU85_14465 [candidate division Zixibacteria bacterium]
MFKAIQIRKSILAALAAIFVFVASSQSLAQEGKTHDGKPSHSLYKGAKALQFRITNNFVLTDFQGVALSGKKHISKNSAIRLGANLYTEFSTEDEDRRIFSSDTTIASSDAENSAQMLILEMQYIRYASIERRIKLFWGAGPSLRFNREIIETDYYDGFNNISRRLRDENKSWGTGATGVIGVEWFATSDISFHTEYILSIMYEWQKIRDDDASGTNFVSISSEETGIQVYASNVRFGLSLYF